MFDMLYKPYLNVNSFIKKIVWIKHSVVVYCILLIREPWLE